MTDQYRELVAFYRLISDLLAAGLFVGGNAQAVVQCQERLQKAIDIAQVEATAKEGPAAHAEVATAKAESPPAVKRPRGRPKKQPTA